MTTTSAPARPAVSVGMDPARPDGIAIEVAALTDPPDVDRLTDLIAAADTELAVILTELGRGEHSRAVLLARAADVVEDVAVAATSVQINADATEISTLVRLMRHVVHAETAPADLPRTPLLTSTGDLAWPELERRGGKSLARALDAITAATTTADAATAYHALAYALGDLPAGPHLAHQWFGKVAEHLRP